MKSITLVHCVDLEISKTQMFGINYLPVWAYTLATYLRPLKNLQINLFDNRVESPSKILKSDIYLFTGINQDLNYFIDFKITLKKKFPNAIFIIGGPVTGSLNSAGKLEQLEEFDHIFVGDGESEVLHLISTLISKKPLDKVIINKNKFDINKSTKMDEILLSKTYQNYYGAVLEVSRGCPFLCEFCDIRVQLDNNKAHSKDIEVIIEEMNFFTKNGINQFLFACDNFIGDSKWAEELCDRIIQWKEETNNSVSIYTWLTINLAGQPRLLKKLRLAGFDMFFIGIESFGVNQLLETAKIQNVKTSLIDSIHKIQSYGFIIVAGLIFGFDSDPSDVVDITLDGINESGLISGDPSLLTALPGTPLYKRMMYSDRLRDGKLGLGGFKYKTNIKYLKDEKVIIKEFQEFVLKYNKGEYQFDRLNKFYQILLESDNYITIKKANYINVSKLFNQVIKKPMTLVFLLFRFIRLFANIDRFIYIIKATFLTLKLSNSERPLWSFYKFWIFIWSNSVLKYSSIKPIDFDIGSVGKDFDYANIVPQKYLDDTDEPIPMGKIKAQRKLTVNALSKITSR
ncbi:MAG: radical SAM superfamily enzyme YgiQ (UPF0313 family) [Thermoproteota archaeon]|jgi:radical SAM superfamily enzyme YgiQ (UPF0313 family)